MGCNMCSMFDVWNAFARGCKLWKYGYFLIMLKLDTFFPMFFLWTAMVTMCWSFTHKCLKSEMVTIDNFLHLPILYARNYTSWELIILFVYLLHKGKQYECALCNWNNVFWIFDFHETFQEFCSSASMAYYK